MLTSCEDNELQASVFCAVGRLVAFGLSRTVGLFGFVEHGWEPVPCALLSVVTETVAVAAVVAAGFWSARGVSRSA